MSSEENKSVGSGITVIVAFIWILVAFWTIPIKEANMTTLFWIFLISGIIGLIISFTIGFLSGQFQFRYDFVSIIFALFILIFYMDVPLGDVIVTHLILLIILSYLASLGIAIGIIMLLVLVGIKAE